MKLTDDYEREWNRGMPIIYTIAAVSVGVLFILGFVFFLNQDTMTRTQKAENAKSQSVENKEQLAEKPASEKTVDELISGSKLTSDELDIWGEYNYDYIGALEDDKTTKKEEKNEVAPAATEVKTEDFSEGGKKTKVLNDKGEETWIPILDTVAKNTYDTSGLVYQEPLMKYFQNNQRASFQGVDVSKQQGYVDYHKLKKAGVEFVMIRLGARGYGSGQLTLDDHYVENIRAATNAGLSVGVYFFSQAITAEEAIQEANMVLENLSGYHITYPIAFDMEQIKGDSARIDNLTVEERTIIAATFLTVIKEAGYKTMLYGNKEWLLTKIDLTKLQDYDIWLSQEEDIPDYPYKFALWQYNTSAKIDGISGKVNMNISFIDYELK